MPHILTIQAIFRAANGLPPRPPKLSDFRKYREANDLIFSAWETGDPSKELDAAVGAFKKSVYCTQAFSVFAERLAYSDAERLTLYSWGSKIAEVYFGQEYFKQNKGCFYGLLETRPYMRAVYAKAQILWELGCAKEAISNFKRLLELNPSDHQGVRYNLMVVHLEQRDFEAFDELYDKYGENSFHYGKYCKLIASLLRKMPDKECLKDLEVALRSNNHVPKLLANPKTQIEWNDFGVSMGGEDGAAEFVMLSKSLWKHYPHEKQWVIQNAARLLPEVQKKQFIDTQETRIRLGLIKPEAN